MLTKAELPDCPVATAVQLIGNKWKLLILRNLLVRPWRFNEMLRSIPGISQKVLTDNLRALERDDLITRTVYPEVSAPRGICAQRIGRDDAPDHQCTGDMGPRLSGDRAEFLEGVWKCLKMRGRRLCRHFGASDSWS